MESYLIQEDEIYYELTKVPTLSFKGMKSDQQDKIQKYIVNKIGEINRYEKTYYEDIFDRIQYDYRYYFKYIMEYQKYYLLMNSLSNFDLSSTVSSKIPGYLNTSRLRRIKKTSKKIRELIEELNDIRKVKLKELQKFSKKNKFYINCKIMPST